MSNTFQPSRYSYGAYGAAEIEDVIVDEAIEVVSGGKKGKGGKGGGKAPDIGGYVGLVGTGLSAILGTGKTERESVAVLEAKLANYQAARKTAQNIDVFGIPMPGSKGWYTNEIRKLEAKIQAGHEQASEERTSATLYTVGRIGFTVGIFAGAGLLTMFVVNQVQKARLQQAEIDRLRGSP